MNSKKIEKLGAFSLAVFGYAAPIGVAAWRVLRRERDPRISLALSKGSKPELRHGPNVDAGSRRQSADQKLESLSHNTPGEAPLDNLARIAAREQRQGRQREHSKLKASEPSTSQATREPEERNVAALLADQSLDSDRLYGWSLPAPERLPIPTYAPAIMAFGIIVFAMGLATTWYVCVAGCVVFAVAAWRWIGELQGE